MTGMPALIPKYLSSIKILLICGGGVAVGFFLIKGYIGTRVKVSDPKVVEQTSLSVEQLPDLASAAQEEAGTSTDRGMTTVNLAVPYLSQMPDGLMVKPWSKACEEASIVMIDEFYRENQEKFMSKTLGKQAMNKLIMWENKHFGYNDDTDASSTARIVNELPLFNAHVRPNPSLEDIKEEIRNNRPVMSVHYGLGLNNPYLHFKADGPVYHLIVLKGFDDEKKEFITHDPGTYQFSGDDYRYSYETIMNSLHDYDSALQKASGPPVVIFTEPRTQSS